MRGILIISGLILLASCKEQGNEQELLSKGEGATRSFLMIDEDSAHWVSYGFTKEKLQNGVTAFNYSSDKDHFVLLLDTINGIYKGVLNSDTATLDLETEKIFIVNGQSFRLLKLVQDKGVTDGEVSHFLDTDRGLIISRSNTWRTAKVLDPQKDNSDFIGLTALLYQLLTDEEIFKNPVPDSSIKFTRPRVE